MITESFIECEGYRIRLRFVTHAGCSYTIFKVYGEKYLKLRQEFWTFQTQEKLTKRSTDYIYNFSDRLEEKYQKLLNEYLQKKS